MIDIGSDLLNRIVVFILILIRMSSLFVITPVFGRNEMPQYLKIGLAFFCSLVLLPLVGNVNLEFANVFQFALVVIKELFVGIVIGYVSFLVFTALYVAGEIIDMQIGFGMVNILDPMLGGQVPLMGNFIYILTTIFFLMIDGHHILFTALFKSYSLIPINGFVFREAMVTNIVSIFADTFVIGFQISLPVLAAAILTQIALGILAKTVPQMNVFVVGMPLQIIVGLLALYFMMPVFFKFIDITFDKMYSYIYLIIKSMAEG